MTTIPIPVDEATAQAFEAAAPTTREQIALFVQGYVARALLSKEERVQLFVEVADQLGATAKANGWNDELKKVALMSASFNALNSALNSDMKLEEMDCKSFEIIFYMPTYPGTKLKKEKKPFWKFW